MTISHYFFPADRVVAEKTAKLLDDRFTPTKSTCLDIPSPGLHDLQDSYLGSSIYMHRLKVLFLQYSRAKLFLSPQSATCVMLWVLYCTVHKLYYETSRVKMTGKEFSTLAQRWRIGRVMYSTPFWVVVTKVEEGWSLVKTCQREVRSEISACLCLQRTMVRASPPNRLFDNGRQAGNHRRSLIQSSFWRSSSIGRCTCAGPGRHEFQT